MKRIDISSLKTKYIRIDWVFDRSTSSRKIFFWHRLDGPSVISYDFARNAKHVNYYLLDASVFLNDLQRLNPHENNNTVLAHVGDQI